jgi:hypothetical protein
MLKDRAGSFAAGFCTIALVFLFGLSALLYLKGVWIRTWPAGAAERAGLSGGITAPLYAAE